MKMHTSHNKTANPDVAVTSEGLARAEQTMRRLQTTERRLFTVFSVVAAGSSNPDYPLAMTLSEIEFEAGYALRKSPTEGSLRRCLEVLSREGLLKRQSPVNFGTELGEGFAPTLSARLVWERDFSSLEDNSRRMPAGRVRFLDEALQSIHPQVRAFSDDVKSVLTVIMANTANSHQIGMSAAEVAAKIPGITSAQVGQWLRNWWVATPLYEGGSGLVTRLAAFVPARWVPTDLGMMAYQKGLFKVSKQG
jgi:hypothetical protein